MAVIFVKTLLGKTYTFENVDLNTLTVRKLKDLIREEDIMFSNIDKISLIYDGIILKNIESALKDYGIKHYSQLHVALRLIRL